MLPTGLEGGGRCRPIPGRFGGGGTRWWRRQQNPPPPPAIILRRTIRGFPAASSGFSASLRSFSSFLFVSLVPTCVCWRFCDDLGTFSGMLSGHTIGLLERNDSSQVSLQDPVSETDEAAEISQKVLYRASFEELADNYVQYDMIIWILISLLLVLAWGVGVVMLLYLPIRRYIMQRDISSRKLYVTPGEIVYKVFRPSFLPFLGFTKIEKCVPLHLVIDIIIEQGCLQSLYGIHTVRIENIAYGKASPVDELQVQGVSDPEVLRKVIISEAVKVIQEVGGWGARTCMEEGDSTPTCSRSLADVSPIGRFHSPSGKMMAASPRLEPGPVLSSDLLLHKLEVVKQSVKKIELLVEGSQASSDDR